MGIGSCSSAVFVFSVLSCHFPLKTLLPVSDKRNKERISKCFHFFPPLPLSSGSLKTPCPQLPKRAIFITVRIFAGSLYSSLCHPPHRYSPQMPLASLMDTCLFLSHQSSSVEPLCNQTFHLYVWFIYLCFACLSLFSCWDVRMICFSLVFACFLGHYHTCQRIILISSESFNTSIKSSRALSDHDQYLPSSL